MKKILILWMMLLLLMTGCSPAEHVSDGTYVAIRQKENAYACPYIDINKEDKTFVHGASLMHSFAVVGDYEIKGDLLKLKPDHESGEIVFLIDGSGLIYDADASTGSLLLWESAEIPDGTVFTALKELEN